MIRLCPSSIFEPQERCIKQGKNTACSVYQSDQSLLVMHCEMNPQSLIKNTVWLNQFVHDRFSGYIGLESSLFGNSIRTLVICPGGICMNKHRIRRYQNTWSEQHHKRNFLARAKVAAAGIFLGDFSSLPLPILHYLHSVGQLLS